MSKMDSWFQQMRKDVLAKRIIEAIRNRSLVEKARHEESVALSHEKVLWPVNHRKDKENLREGSIVQKIEMWHRSCSRNESLM